MEYNKLLDNIVFDTYEEAREVLIGALDIAKTYGLVCLADIKDLAGVESCYNDRRLQWAYSPKLSSKSTIYHIRSGWIIRMPDDYIDERDKHVHYRDYAQLIKPDPEPQPLYITLNTESIDDVDETLANLFKYVYTITDRVVNISIV